MSSSSNVAVAKLIEAAAIIAGSETRLAVLTGYSQNAIWSAKRRGRVTAEMANKIDAATGGAIPRHRLRPDLFEVPTSAVAV
jgi:DNA-binding transcriptional regulator YdaS (Cro superfamily)